MGLAALFAKKQGTLVTFLVAIIGAYAHEQLDAPLADVLSDFGI